MKKITTPLLYAILAVAILTGCKDDDEKSNKTDLLTAKAWHISKYEISANGATEDVTDELSEGTCENDDTSVFHKDGKYEEKTGGTECFSGDEDMTGTWVWKDSESRIVVTIDGEVIDAKLEQLTSSTLKISVEDDDLQGAVLIITFTAQ
jgi:hypothetical protein